MFDKKATYASACRKAKHPNAAQFPVRIALISDRLLHDNRDGPRESERKDEPKQLTGARAVHD